MPMHKNLARVPRDINGRSLVARQHLEKEYHAGILHRLCPWWCDCDRLSAPAAGDGETAKI